MFSPERRATPHFPILGVELGALAYIRAVSVLTDLTSNNAIRVPFKVSSRFVTSGDEGDNFISFAVGSV